jgi:amino acid transporter
MVGIGPFITIPLFIAAMGGPQAMIAWVAAAVLVLCDGLVWSELGAALPGSGGSYHFLREIYGRYRWGRLMPFLFIWQFLVSGTLELASGYVGVMPYVEYALPGLKPALDRWGVPGGTASLAALTCLAVGLLLSRGIRTVGWFAVVLMAGAVATVLTVIVAGLTRFDRSLLAMPPGAFDLGPAWLLGLAASMRIAIYDYLGYYNVCHLGDEVVSPGRTIPRAVILSIAAVALMYLTMNVAILGVVPWSEAMRSPNIAATFMERLFGRDAAVAFTAMIVWTALASVFAGTLGASRIPYAAARAGDFFPVFGRLHPRGRYPWVSLLALTLLTAAFCFVGLEDLVNAAVTVRILVVFVGQIVALHLLRTARPDRPLPFRMWLYPLPSLVALAGWLLLFATSEPAVLLSAAGVLASGAAVFVAWRAVVGPSADGRGRPHDAAP